jgi:hypothetical protein
MLDQNNMLTYLFLESQLRNVLTNVRQLEIDNKKSPGNLFTIEKLKASRHDADTIIKLMGITGQPVINELEKKYNVKFKTISE